MADEPPVKMHEPGTAPDFCDARIAEIVVNMDKHFGANSFLNPVPRGPGSGVRWKRKCTDEKQTLTTLYIPLANVTHRSQKCPPQALHRCGCPGRSRSGRTVQIQGPLMGGTAHFEQKLISSMALSSFTPSKITQPADPAPSMGWTFKVYGSSRSFVGSNVG